MKGKSVSPARAAAKPSWAAAAVVDWARVTLLLGTLALLVLFAHSRLTEAPLSWLTLTQYALVLAAGSAVFAFVPRPVRGTTPGYAGACALGGFVAVLALAWLVEVDLSALAAPPAAAADRLGDVPLRNIVSPEVRSAGPSILGDMAAAAVKVDPVYLALWAAIGAAGGAAYGWATRALR
ncbi:MAG TPA: hypothetical protein VMM12_08150 [Longimicrobiales bacterium]|nr:hypothetical protein [Longimicrobiales bacterium]